MCVITAVKLPRDRKTGKPLPNAKWRLGKIRDRIYVPTFSVERFGDGNNGAGQLFLVDQDTDWTEGCSVDENGNFIGLVNAALNNKSDKKDDGKKEKNKKAISKNGEVLRKSLQAKDIKACVKYLIDNRIDGNTLATDGDRLFYIEIYLPEEVKLKYAKIVDNTSKKYEDVVKPNEYVCNYSEITDPKINIMVRTNHGEIDPKAGYTTKDGDMFQSSIKRKKYAEKAIIDNVFEPMDLLIWLTRLGAESIDSNAFLRPVRLKGLAKSKTNPELEIFSTASIMLDPSGTIFIRPIECKFNDISINKLTDKKRKTNLVILPAHIPLFEKKKYDVPTELTLDEKVLRFIRRKQ